jgi:hypothetical protein
MNVARLWAVLLGLLSTALPGSAAYAGLNPIPVPEPTSLSLLAAGVAGVAWVKFRRRK